MRHSDKARELRTEFQRITGIFPKYPRSKQQLDELSAALNNFIEAQEKYRNSQKKKEDKEVFDEEFTRLSQIDSDINKFDLDTQTTAGKLKGEAFKLLKEAKREHRREGAEYVFSSWRQETRDYTGLRDIEIDDHIRIVGGNMVLDYTLSEKRAANILEQLNGVFLLKTKFLREEEEEDLWIVEDGYVPIRWGATRGRKIVEISKEETEPGALFAIDQRFFNIAYPVSAVVYGLYPMREPNPENLQPMRNGDMNCVARRILEHFSDKKRGDGLTATRRLKISKWENTVHEEGATLQDVSKLERIIMRSIVVQDIAGEDLYNSGKYQSRGASINITLHNGHAWGANLRFPVAREVIIYQGDIWEAIRSHIQYCPTAVWLIGGGDNRLSADQFVLQDGRTFRTREMHDHLEQVCRNLPTDDQTLVQKVFSENHAANIIAREKNGWKPTPVNFIEDIQNSCVEHSCGGLWNAQHYNVDDVISIDMKACYPSSFKGQGEAAPWFQRFGHPRNRMTRVSINGELPKNIGTGFAKMKSWQFADNLHPVIGSWFGFHFSNKQWVPIVLLSYMVETGLLTSLQVTEAIISFKTQKNVWLPQSRDQSCAIIGKFTQGSKADCKILTRRLVIDQGELDFLVQDCRKSGTLLGAPERCPLGWILSYYDGSQPQFTHLRSSMLAYAHINLLQMLRRFSPEEAVRVATDSIYIKRKALHKLRNISAYVSPSEISEGVNPGQWRDKGEKIFSFRFYAVYTPKPEYWGSTNEDVENSTEPSYNDPLTRHSLSYLNGGGGSGKTTRAITLFKDKKPLVLTHTHRLAKEIRNKKGVAAQTYHSFFRFCGVRKARCIPEDLENLQKKHANAKLKESGCTIINQEGLKAPIRVMKDDEIIFEDRGSQIFYRLNPLIDEEELIVEPITYTAKKDGGVLLYPGESIGPQIADTWSEERMGQKFVPRVIIWDEICTVPRNILEIFLTWLDSKGCQVICSGDQGQPPPIAGESPHDWLKKRCDYYEEVLEDYRAKCDKLRALKKAIRLQPDKIQCQKMREALPSCRGWDSMIKKWHPRDMILVSRKLARDRAQELLFKRHEEAFPEESVPILYHPKDSRKQNVMVDIPGSKDKEELVLNDVVFVSVETAKKVYEGKYEDWRLGYALTVHSSQGLTIENPQKVWIIDDWMQWSNLAYLAVSRVEYLHQLERCCAPPDECRIPEYDEKQAIKNIAKKLQAYKRTDAVKGLSNNLRMKDVDSLKIEQENRCAACNIELLWCYEVKDTRQFSIDRIDNTKGHTRDNCRLTCLECNRKRGMAVL